MCVKRFCFAYLTLPRPRAYSLKILNERGFFEKGSLREANT